MRTSLLAMALGLFFSSSALADPVGGTKVDEDLLRPEQQVQYTIALRGGEQTLFTLRGDGDGDIDCCLFSSSGLRLKCDVDETDICSISFWPSSTGVFYFRAVNSGRSASYYTFVAR